jgi:hypothetical protein
VNPTNKDDRAWNTDYLGEYSTDAGGPFRDSLSAMCQELQDFRLPLLVKCPNGRAAVGANREKFVPNPAATRPLGTYRDARSQPPTATNRVVSWR